MPTQVQHEPSTSKANTPGSLPRELLTFVLVDATVVLISLCDALLRSHRLGVAKGFQYLFLMDPLFDLRCFLLRMLYLHTPTFFTLADYIWTYPAPCVFVYRFLYLGGRSNGIWPLYLTSLILLVTTALFLFASRLRKAGLGLSGSVGFPLSALLLSWPIYFSIERGNIEGFLWLGLALALALYIQGRWTAAAVGIGIIAAFKIYPILFLALFLPAKRYRELLLGILAAAMTSILGLLYLSRNLVLAARFVLHGIQKFLAVYSAHFDALANGFDHSAWTLIKTPLSGHPSLIKHGVSAYTLFAGLLATWLFFARIRKLPRFNQLLSLCVLTVVLPSTSFDYTLQSLYIPLGWLCLELVRFRRTATRIDGVTPMMVCFGLILGPLTFVHWDDRFVAGQAKCLALLYLLSLAVRYPIPDTLDGRIESRV